MKFDEWVAKKALRVLMDCGILPIEDELEEIGEYYFCDISVLKNLYDVLGEDALACINLYISIDTDENTETIIITKGEIPIPDYLDSILYFMKIRTIYDAIINDKDELLKYLKAASNVSDINENFYITACFDTGPLMIGDHEDRIYLMKKINGLLTPYTTIENVQKELVDMNPVDKNIFILNFENIRFFILNNEDDYNKHIEDFNKYINEVENLFAMKYGDSVKESNNTIIN